ncbi:MAG TPA: hypothetical protein VEL75_15365 [Candidatus Methylomirabilis sp.]|nr:hypothetical protein [Candidatus Methylomirabilis sp.]
MTTHRRSRAWLFGTLGACLLACAGEAEATADLGQFCWQDNFGATWKIDLLIDTSGLNITVTGARIVGFTCNGTNEIPVIGAMRVVGGALVLGAQSIANEPGTCQSTTWQGVAPISNAVFNGGAANANGQTFGFTLSPVPCVTPFAAEKSTTPAAPSPADPNAVH